jgi:hypothetical protein
MKNTFSNVIGLGVLMALAAGTIATAQSADEDKTSIQVRVTEKKDGKTQVNERHYEVNPMSDADQKLFINKVLDSLGVDGKGQQQVSIIINDHDGKLRVESRGAGDRSLADRSTTDRNSRQRVEIRSRNNDEPMTWSWRDGDNSLHFDTDELRSNLRRLQKDMEPRLEALNRNFSEAGDRMGKFWNNDVMHSASTVRTLNAYPNNPDNGVLNLRFNTPDKGDVHITVTDTQGKEVGKKTIKDFSGEFVGQIELKKNTKGTLFVTVVQNEDGTVRRVVLK